MVTLNKVMLIGNLTRDPEMKFTPAGAAVTSFGLAVNRNYKGADGQRKSEACFLEIVSWGKQAETSAEYLKKGRQCLIEGRLTYDEWTDKTTGQKRNKIKVVAEHIEFMSTPGADKDAAMKDATAPVAEPDAAGPDDHDKAPF